MKTTQVILIEALVLLPIMEKMERVEKMRKTMEKVIDCMGMGCPLPVVNAKKAVEEFTEDGRKSRYYQLRF